MPMHAVSPQTHARRALQRLAERGGKDVLPYVLKSTDVIPIMGRTWFQTALHLDGLPGIQAVRYGAWRCERETFVNWLQEISDEPEHDPAPTTPEVAFAGSHAA